LQTPLEHGLRTTECGSLSLKIYSCGLENESRINARLKLPCIALHESRNTNENIGKKRIDQFIEKPARCIETQYLLRIENHGWKELHTMPVGSRLYLATSSCNFTP
jgi:hypothetical protein